MIEAFLIAQSIVIAAFAVVLLLVVRQVGVLSLRLGPSGSRTTGNGPALGADLVGDVFLQRVLAARKTAERPAILVAFVSPYCVGCQVLFPVLKTVAREEGNRLQVIAVARDLRGPIGESVSSQLGRNVVLVEDETVFEAWQVSGTPYCVVLDRDRKVAAKGLAHTGEHIESLLTSLELGIPTLEHYYSQRGARHESPSDGIAVDGALRDERGEVADAAQG